MICVETLIKYLLVCFILLTLPASTLVSFKLWAWTLTACDLESMLHIPLASLVSFGTALVLNHASRVVDLMSLSLITEVKMAILSDNKSFLL